MSDLWSAITLDDTPQPYYWVEWGSLFDENMSHSFGTDGDEMPEGMLKLAHTQGVIAKVKWEPIGDANGYEGLYKSGSSNIIMRLSETGMLHEESIGLVPSVAFKWLRDGQWSDNIVAMPSFGNSKSWNFFKEDMATRVRHFRRWTCETNTIRKKLG